MALDKVKKFDTGGLASFLGGAAPLPDPFLSLGLTAANFLFDKLFSSNSVPLTPEEKVLQGLEYLANQQNALQTSGSDQDEGRLEAMAGNEETLKQLVEAGMALGMTQAQLNPAIKSAVGPLPTSGAFGAPPQETSALMDLVRAAGGKVVEGTADLGNLVAQAVTLGQGPKLEAVIPNILDMIRGNVGGTLVFGGGQRPVPYIGTGQSGIGAGTNVGLDIPILGPAISAAVAMHKQGGTLADIVRSIPGALINNVPAVLSGVAAAGLLFDEEDKKTLVNLGVDPTIIKTQGSNVGGAGTDTIDGGAGTDTIDGGAGTDTLTKRQPDVVVGGDNKNVNVDPKGLGRTDTTTDALKGTVAVRDMAGSVAPQVGGQVDVSNAVSRNRTCILLMLLLIRYHPTFSAL